LGIKIEWVWVRESDPEAKSTPAETTGEVYQFMITLMDSKPPIWRRV
jgi:hypothetical protein